MPFSDECSHASWQRLRERLQLMEGNAMEMRHEIRDRNCRLLEMETANKQLTDALLQERQQRAFQESQRRLEGLHASAELSPTPRPSIPAGVDLQSELQEAEESSRLNDGDLGQGRRNAPLPPVGHNGVPPLNFAALRTYWDGKMRGAASEDDTAALLVSSARSHGEEPTRPPWLQRRLREVEYERNQERVKVEKLEDQVRLLRQQLPLSDVPTEWQKARCLRQSTVSTSDADEPLASSASLPVDGLDTDGEGIDRHETARKRHQGWMQTYRSLGPRAAQLRNQRSVGDILRPKRKKGQKGKAAGYGTDGEISLTQLQRGFFAQLQQLAHSGMGSVALTDKPEQRKRTKRSKTRRTGDDAALESQQSVRQQASTRIDLSFDGRVGRSTGPHLMGPQMKQDMSSKPQETGTGWSALRAVQTRLTARDVPGAGPGWMETLSTAVVESARGAQLFLNGLRVAAQPMELSAEGGASGGGGVLPPPSITEVSDGCQRRKWKACHSVALLESGN
ncbi:unnamed protein product [Vitrella brassicaformis CCMP3155]|uniref:Uncharacterized protein n=1 Tax=Vitrella brassicaformis (strain CCMP3155) TaxID=1169540 RepID=A0A0G4EEP2_VITBC|nr:unnamed protein product [Vitrella brassicaformis CCMP3155]|eukprot:CEL94151.1 unnamed protein product [Vitrella brassicaformis CCMP3155]